MAAVIVELPKKTIWDIGIADPKLRLKYKYNREMREYN
jgi:hypothetical protein